MNKKLLASAGALVALGVASGGAFTASNTGLEAKTAGFGTQSVSGATLADVAFGYNANRSEITQATLQFTSTQTAKTVGFEFTGGTNPSKDMDCAVDPLDDTKYLCDFTTDTQLTSDATGYNVTVIDTQDAA